MKKGKIILSSLITTSLLLGGCSSKTEEKKENPITNATDKEKVQSSSNNGEYTFKDGKVTMEDIDLTITSYKIIPIGEEGNKYGKTPVIAFWYKVTNKSDKDIDVSSAWTAVFSGSSSVVQDNDKNKINKLEVALAPDDKLLKDKYVIIKKGGTVEGAIAYELTDLKTNVKLTAHKGIGGIELGSQEFKVN